MALRQLLIIQQRSSRFLAMDAKKISLFLLIVEATLFLFIREGADAQAIGATYSVCDQLTISGNNAKYGYLTSDNYPSAYGYYVSCTFEIDVTNPQYQYIALWVMDWVLDQSGYGDRFTILANNNGYWFWVTDVYYWTSGNINNFRTTGSIRIQWYTDGGQYYYFCCNQRWKIAWTFQKYVFGCELYPQPYISPNTTKYGVIKSPFFPEYYPLNSYCQTYIDVDQAVDTVEFVPVMFKLRPGDILYFYTGDYYLGNWVQYAAFTSTNLPTTFRIYAADVRVLFTSDYSASHNGYQFYWRVISKERYPIYRQENLFGFWPMTAYHRGNDIAQGCNANNYPTTAGTIIPTSGPFGNTGTGLFLKGTYLNMTSSLCTETTLMNGSFTISAFAQTAVQTALVEHLSNVNTGAVSSQFWTNYPGANQLFAQPVISGVPDAVSIATSLSSQWSHVTSSYNGQTGEMALYADNTNVYSHIGAANGVPTASQGFLFGTRDSRQTFGGVPQYGQFSCLTMYSAALSLADIAQVRLMCQKFHQQYEIFRGQSLVGWWPLNSISSNGLVLDVSGNALHGTAISTTGVTLTNGPNGTSSSAFNFNGGSNSYVNFPYSMATLQSFTLSAYVKSNTVGIRPLVEFLVPSQTGLVMWIWPNNTYLHTNPYVSSGIDVKAYVGSFGSWQFLTSMYDSRTGLMSLWVNAVQIGAVNVGSSRALGVSTSGFILGSTVQTSTRFLGQMACLSLYKIALTSFQLGKVMAACNSGFNQPPLVDVIGFWPLTGVTQFLDISGNEYVGTPITPNVTFQTGPFGVPKTAIMVGAVQGSYVNFPYAAINFGYGSYTIACYIKALTWGQGPILEFPAGPLMPGSWGIHFFFNYPGSGNIWINTFGCQFGVWAFNLNQWVFVAVTYDAIQGKASMYRDGALLGTCNGIGNATSAYGFNLGYRVNGNNQINAHISCLSMYQIALDTDGIGRLQSTCQSLLMDQALRDQTKLPEINCNFDNGFCGWSQDFGDDFDWVLGHDNTPTGQPNVFTTGPRFGKSAERIDALDQYALINTALAGWGGFRARLISPVISPGWHCFSMWYYMGGGNVNKLTVLTATGQQQIFSKSGPQGKQWFFVASSFFLSDPDFIAIDGYSGTTNIYADIAIDDIRVIDGQCGAATRCPRGWIDYRRKCYMTFINYQLNSGLASSHCSERLKGRLSLPEDDSELAFLKSLIGGNTIYLDGDLTAGNWVNSFGYPISYLPWASSEPTAGKTQLGLTSSGFVALTGTTGGIVCEVTKLEVQHLGFNCTFDNKHLCGWFNIFSESSDPANGLSSIDADVWGSLGMPWQTEDTENGPDWDWTKGNNRGYYLMLADNSVSSCSNLFSDLYSPLVKATNKPQCLRFRTLRTPTVSRIEVYQWTITNNGTIAWGPALIVTDNAGVTWRTFEVELATPLDYMIVIRLFMSCNTSGAGNQVVDEILLFDSTCTIPLYNQQSASTLNSLRPQPGYQDSVDTINDNNFYNLNDQYYPWRDLPQDQTNWFCTKGQYLPGFRRTGPQSDYTGEGYYLNLDFTWCSMCGTARWSGPAIPSGQKCFIFHYFAYGYDVGELRLVDGNGRYLFARQRSQSPAWKEHRILINSLKPTNLIFEGSSGQWDGNTHFQKYQSIQLDDIYTRNGSDLCLGYMDCDFDSFSDIADCGWVQNDTDDADWVRNKGETPAGNGNTGPTSDQTTGLGHYLYFDATNLRPGATARVHMPPVASGNFCLTFYYYMWGQDIGNLRVFYVPQSNIQNANGNFPAYSELTLWQRYGQQGNSWNRAFVPIQQSYPQILTFEAVRGGGDRGDIAIDDVVLLTGACPVDRSLSCSFERGDTCAWRNDLTDQLNFVVNKGKTPGTPLSGPEGDSTGAYAGGYYVYLPSTTGNPGDKARLISPILQSGTVCFQASYNMRGRQLGVINIYANSNPVVRLRGGTTGYEWRRIVSTITSTASFTIIIEATRGLSSFSEIAFDDITVTDGPCYPSTVPVAQQFSTLNDYQTLVGYNLLGHGINAVPLQLPSVYECMTKCQRTPGCLSVNYNALLLQCQLNNASSEMDPYNLVQTSGNVTYASLASGFKRLDMRLQSICAIDSPICSPTPNKCKPSPSAFNTTMLVCQCQQLGASCFMPQDCSVAFDNGYVTSGVYLIQPTASLPPIQTWCDMDITQQRGYTVLVNRYNGGTRFHNRKLAEYQGFFGSPSREFWIGLDAMNRLTSQNSYGYVIEGSLYNSTYSSIVGMSLSQPFFVANNLSNYQISLAKVGAMTTTMFNRSFSTYDADQTGTNACPSKNAGAGWWYNACLDGSLTGAYRPNEGLSASPMGMYATDFGGAVGLSSMRLKITQLP